MQAISLLKKIHTRNCRESQLNEQRRCQRDSRKNNKARHFCVSFGNVSECKMQFNRWKEEKCITKKKSIIQRGEFFEGIVDENQSENFFY